MADLEASVLIWRNGADFILYVMELKMGALCLQKGAHYTGVCQVESVSKENYISFNIFYLKTFQPFFFKSSMSDLYVRSCSADMP